MKKPAHSDTQFQSKIQSRGSLDPDLTDEPLYQEPIHYQHPSAKDDAGPPRSGGTSGKPVIKRPEYRSILPQLLRKMSSSDEMSF